MTKKQRGNGQKKRRVVQYTQTDSPAKPEKRAVKRHTQRPYTANPDSQYLTQTEIQALFAVIESPRDRAIFRLVYHRGLRSHEPGLLQLSDWNERDGLLHVRRGKNSISRDYRLMPAEATALRAWLKIRGRAPGPLFPSRQIRAGGLGIHRNQLDRLYRGYCAAAGIRPEKAHMHAIKHSTGTHLAERGNSADIIQDWLGHRAASSTQVYMHFSQRRRDEAYERNKDWR
jgi:integrase/recombinase XerD